MFNTLYAIDADNGTVCWTQNFGSEIIAEDVENDQNTSWCTWVGILGTPVIDPNTILCILSPALNRPTAPKFTHTISMQLRSPPDLP
jgi:PQQ enzyme repeat